MKTLFLSLLGSGAAAALLLAEPPARSGAPVPLTPFSPFHAAQASCLAPGGPVQLEVKDLDGREDPLGEGSSAGDHVRLLVRAWLDDGASARVECSLSSGLGLVSGELVFDDEGQGMEITVQRLDDLPQSISVATRVTPPEGPEQGSFTSFGWPAPPKVDGVVDDPLLDLVPGAEPLRLVPTSMQEGGR
jgi:hypothetical protein